jgi:hypothetical protein
LAVHLSIKELSVPRQDADHLRSRCVRWFSAIGLLFNGILVLAASSQAGVLDASWIAPIANTDGSPLTELALYRVYYSIFDAPCPGSTFVEVASPSLIPSATETISFRLTGLTAGAVYGISVTAVDTHGNESACSDTASAVARDDSAVTPSDGVVQAQSANAATGNVPRHRRRQR